MKRLVLASLSILLAFALVATDADAKRMGGGRSLGMQRSVPQSSVAPSPSTPQAATPAPSVAPSAQARAPQPTPAATPSRMSRWLGPIAGIAAGLGLAALLSHLGLSPDFGGLLLVIVLAAAVYFIARAFFARRSAAPAYDAPYGAGAQRVEPRFDTSAPVASADAPPAQAQAVRPDFDTESFLREAKRNFNRVQSAYDNADRRGLADVMTPEMFSEVQNDLDRRGAHHPTEVVQLDAEIVDFVSDPDRYVVSVRFHGLAREDGGELAQPFEEVWHLVKPIDGSRGWMLAGIQQLQTAS